MNPQHHTIDVGGYRIDLRETERRNVHVRVIVRTSLREVASRVFLWNYREIHGGLPAWREAELWGRREVELLIGCRAV